MPLKSKRLYQLLALAMEILHFNLFMVTLEEELMVVEDLKSLVVTKQTQHKLLTKIQSQKRFKQFCPKMKNIQRKQRKVCMGRQQRFGMDMWR